MRPLLRECGKGPFSSERDKSARARSAVPQRMDANRSRSQGMCAMARPCWPGWWPADAAAEDDRPLAARGGRGAAPGLPLLPREDRLRRRPVPAVRRLVRGCVRHRAAPGRARPGRAGGLVAEAEQAGARRAEVDRIWRQRLERAEFAADRARRQYQLAEPENRLVPGSWRRTGRPRWLSVSASARSTTGSPPPAPVLLRQPSATRSGPWPATSPPSGTRLPPPAPTASG